MLRLLWEKSLLVSNVSVFQFEGKQDAQFCGKTDLRRDACEAVARQVSDVVMVSSGKLCVRNQSCQGREKADLCRDGCHRAASKIDGR